MLSQDEVEEGDEEWRRCSCEDCDYFDEWMHKRCWERHHDRPRSKGHTFETASKDFTTELERHQYLQKAKDVVGAGLQATKAFAAQGSAMGFSAGAAILAQSRAVVVPPVPDPTFLQRVLPCVFPPPAAPAPVAAAPLASAEIVQVCGRVTRTNIAVASVVATVEISVMYYKWHSSAITTREFQIATAGAAAGAAGGVFGAWGAGLAMSSPAAASAMAGVGLATGGMGAATIVVISVLLGGALGAGIARGCVATPLVEWFQTKWYGSKYDEEKELLYIIGAAERLNLVQCENPFQFDDKILNSAWRRKALSLHPDQNPLSLYDGEPEDEFEARKARQKAAFELASLDWAALKKYLIDRQAGKWDSWKGLINKRWYQCAGIAGVRMESMIQASKSLPDSPRSS